MFSQGQYTEAVFQKWPGLYLVPAAKPGSVKNHPGRAGFEGMKGSGKAAEVWH